MMRYHFLKYKKRPYSYTLPCQRARPRSPRILLKFIRIVKHLTGRQPPPIFSHPSCPLHSICVISYQRQKYLCQNIYPCRQLFAVRNPCLPCRPIPQTNCTCQT